MTEPDSGEESTLERLPREECVRLLQKGLIGRVVYTYDAMPAAQPVNYAVDGDEIVFRTGGGDKLKAAVNNAVVGFEVDEFDSAARTGWSVLVVGQAYHILNPERLASLDSRIPAPWASGHAMYTVAVPLTKLTGRRLVRQDSTPN
jgi:nitroimidazol reductase NimA-like FMN-containing flavoprotein (pyridoxamine 5'-phosphate oxidase superfamily)